MSKDADFTITIDDAQVQQALSRLVQAMHNPQSALSAGDAQSVLDIIGDFIARAW